jgi:hypothetical protein
MRQREELPLDPEIVASLDAIDAVLSGRVVDPAQADVAELALLLRADRPRMDRDFAARLDERVQRRFEPVPKSTGRSGPGLGGAGLRRWPRRRWLWTPAAGLAAALVVAVVIVIGGAGGPATPKRPVAVNAGTASRRTHSSPQRLLRPAAGTLQSRASSAVRPFGRATTSATAAMAPANANGQALTLAPVPNGRKIIQSAQLSLTAAPSRVDQVAQEVFNAVGQAHGIVKSSRVTATGGPGGYAQFELSIPSSALPQTMASLSTLPHARVASRTDNTQDVNDSYRADQRRLADARALRASLLRQLASAVTQGEIDSLTARIHNAESSISSDENALRSLQHQIAYSQVTLTINAGAVPVTTKGSGGFTLGKAAHDAGRVLTVAAGVVLIALAALLPVGLLLALLWWIGGRVRHRRRLQALDLT